MVSILKSKNGLNDVSMIAFLVLFFLFLGLIIPYINASFGSSYSEYDVGIADQYDDDTSITTVTGTSLLFSIITIFFWSFGAVNIYVDLLLTVFRIILAILIYRQLRSGAG